MSLCEIRVPTYKRPHLLKRALESLIAQDYPYWKALVMDDSPEQEAKEIVNLFADERIIYSPNQYNLGSAGNIDRAFQSNSILEGMYACILEDDNWLMPTFLSENISSLEKQQTKIILRNQEIYLQKNDQLIPTGRTTRGSYLRQKQYTPLELSACIFLFEGISNGGLFWKTSIQSNLQVGSQVKDAGLQEYCRTLQIAEDIYFEAKPLCFWSEMPINLSLRNPIKNRMFGRGLQSAKRYIIQKYGENIVSESKKIGIYLNDLISWESSLLDALYLNYNFQKIKGINFYKRYIKSYAKYKLVQDPLKVYFENSYPKVKLHL